MNESRPIDASWRPAAGLLQDRVVLLTGAADGIGRAVAIACAGAGAATILLDRNVPGLEAVHDEITAAGHPQPALYPLDLKGATPADYAALADVVGREFGRLDGLVHNAAYLGTLCPLSNHDDALWYEVMQVNLHGPFQLTRACLDLLARADAASVVFAADAVGRRGRAYWGAYGVSKAGLENLAEVLADELESNTRIRVNTIDPGAVRSRLRSLAYPGEDPAHLRPPEAVANAYLWLLGADSAGETGRRFTVTAP